MIRAIQCRKRSRLGDFEWRTRTRSTLTDAESQLYDYGFDLAAILKDIDDLALGGLDSVASSTAFLILSRVYDLDARLEEWYFATCVWCGKSFDWRNSRCPSRGAHGA
jgi:hypothetical protein